MKPKTSETPAIYYVVQGRATENNTDYIEHAFMDINPLNARERAFSYLEYYVQLLHQGNKISFKDKPNVVDSEIKLEYFNNNTVSFSENNFGSDGIAIYMVVKEPIEYMDKTDNLEDRFLIYCVQDLTEIKIETIKKSLIREYGYYRYSKIDTSKIEISISFLKKAKSKMSYQSKHTYTTLKTPFNDFFSIVTADNSSDFNAKVVQDFKVIDLKTTTFISKLDWHTIRVHVASFLNSDGGKVYLGKLINNQMINCIEEASISKCTALLKKNISPYFPKHTAQLSFRFVKINNVLVPIIEVKGFNKNFCFYDNVPKNNFYFRNKKGLQTINETEKIAEYILNNNKLRMSDLNDILDIL